VRVRSASLEASVCLSLAGVMITRAIIMWSVWVGVVRWGEGRALAASLVRVMIGRFDESIHP
jgi:hypothetical protein